MEEPWFKRFGVIGYVPVHRKGVLTIRAMLAVTIPALAVFLCFAERYPVISWFFGIVAFAAAFVGHALVVLHMGERE